MHSEYISWNEALGSSFWSKWERYCCQSPRRLAGVSSSFWSTSSLCRRWSKTGIKSSDNLFSDIGSVSCIFNEFFKSFYYEISKEHFQFLFVHSLFYASVLIVWQAGRNLNYYVVYGVSISSIYLLNIREDKRRWDTETNPKWLVQTYWLKCC